jgi:hypothetical protein
MSGTYGNGSPAEAEVPLNRADEVKDVSGPSGCRTAIPTMSTTLSTFSRRGHHLLHQLIDIQPSQGRFVVEYAGSRFCWCFARFGDPTKILNVASCIQGLKT